jgi:hypothetical protein
MAYAFVPSYFDYGPRNATIKPLTINVHMAEGGGTVGFLARKNPNGVSVHYVIEYGGRIVQMLHESHVNGSINPRDIRTTDDPPYTFRGETIVYGATAAKRCLGIWWEDPNRATIGIEIEGFAKDGPNVVQAAALEVLVADIRTRQPGAPLVGHRDFADYKACPGKRIDWAALGGHARIGEQPEEPMIDGHPMAGGDGTVTLKEGRGLFDLVTGGAINPTDRVKTSYCRFHLAKPDGGDPKRQDGYLVRHSNRAYLAFEDAVDFVPATPSAPAPGPHSHNVSVDVDGQTIEGSVTFA